MISSPEADGKGEYDDGFTVKAGSKARQELVPSAPAWISKTRKKLLSEGVLAPEGNQLVFVRDYKFQTPSGASNMVLGRSSNGWIEWKQADGTTLDQVERVDRKTHYEPLAASKVKEIQEKHEQLVNSGQV